MSGSTRNNVAAIDTAGVLQAWNPNAGTSGSTYLRSIAINGNMIYLGGWFTAIGGITRGSLAALNTSGELQTWNPTANINAAVNVLIATNSTVYAAGLFQTMGGIHSYNISSINTDGSVNW